MDRAFYEANQGRTKKRRAIYRGSAPISNAPIIARHHIKNAHRIKALRLKQSGSIPEFFDGAPDLAIEATSPSDKHRLHLLRDKIAE